MSMKRKKHTIARAKRVQPPAIPQEPVKLADPGQLMDRRLLERHLADVTRLIEAQQFKSPDAINAFLETLDGGLPPRAAPRTPLEEAQELVYQAMEATGRRRRQLLEQALALSPDCADAYVVL